MNLMLSKEKILASQTLQNQKPILTHSKPYLSVKDQNAIEAILKSGMVAEGNVVKEFEHAVTQYLGLVGGVATSSGTGALFLAMKGLGIGDQDEVIIPTYVCKSVWDAVKATGADPVLCDIGEDWCVNRDTVKPLITKRTKAIIVVHTYGIMAEVAPICNLGIPVIEDTCQALGASWDGKMAGTIGDFCILSFHGTKLLTTGEGGMVLTKDQKWLSKMRDVKQGNSNQEITVYRQPMSDLQAALGLSQLAQFKDFLKRRRFIADYYFAHLQGLPIKLPHPIRDRSIFFRFPLRIRGDFEAFRALFDAEGIQVRHGVDALLHRIMKVGSTKFPMAQKYFNETLSIPIYPALRRKECVRVVEACHLILAHKDIDSM